MCMVGAPKNEGTLTGFIPNGQKMFQTSAGASSFGLLFFTAYDYFCGVIFLSPKGFL